MELIGIIIILIAIAVLGFGGACYVVKLWTGCDTDEAIKKIRDFVNGTPETPLYANADLCQEIWENIKNNINKKYYEDMNKLLKTSTNISLYSYGYSSGLPYIAFSFYCDEEDKIVLENLIGNIVKKYLAMFNYDTDILIDWKERYDLQMPFLMIRYSTKKEESEIIKNCLAFERNKIVKKHSPLIDNTEDEDLI